MKQGKIQYIDPIGQWNDMDKYKITFADGGQYSFLAKGNFKANIGDEISYEVTNDQYKSAKIIREYRPQSNVMNAPSGNKDQLIVRQTCIKAASELHSNKQISDQEVINTAQAYYNWIYGQ
jgi:hypothetical protein